MHCCVLAVFYDVECERMQNLAPELRLTGQHCNAKTLSWTFETLPAIYYFRHDDKCQTGLNLTSAVIFLVFA